MAIGFSALANTTGSENMAIGFEAGLNNIAGNFNTFVGSEAGRGSAGAYSGNTTIGRRAGYSLTTDGSENTLIGSQAGEDITTGAGNVCIGYTAGESQITTDSNELWIANTDTATPLIYGEFPNTLLQIRATDFNVMATSRFGNDSNYVQIDTDGDLTLVGTARVIVGEDIDLAIPKRPAANPPAEGTEASFPTLDFDDTVDESILVVYHLKENYASAGTVRMHVDFFVDTAPVADANIVWGLEYQKLSHGDNFNFGATATLTTVETVTSGTPANDKKIHETDNFTLTTTGWVPHDIILIRLYRDADNSADNFTGDARLMHIHIHFLSDKSGEDI